MDMNTGCLVDNTDRRTDGRTDKEDEKRIVQIMRHSFVEAIQAVARKLMVSLCCCYVIAAGIVDGSPWTLSGERQNIEKTHHLLSMARCPDQKITQPIREGLAQLERKMAATECEVIGRHTVGAGEGWNMLMSNL